MEAGFTPGPWKSERDLPHNQMPRVYGGDGSLICEVGNMGATQDQWEANACLIAAAPKLLAALERACEYDPHILEDVTEVGSAIAEARGGPA